MQLLLVALVVLQTWRPLTRSLWHHETPPKLQILLLFALSKLPHSPIVQTCPKPDWHTIHHLPLNPACQARAVAIRLDPEVVQLQRSREGATCATEAMCGRLGGWSDGVICHGLVAAAGDFEPIWIYWILVQFSAWFSAQKASYHDRCASFCSWHPCAVGRSSCLPWVGSEPSLRRGNGHQRRSELTSQHLKGWWLAILGWSTSISSPDAKQYWCLPREIWVSVNHGFQAAKLD